MYYDESEAGEVEGQQDDNASSASVEEETAAPSVTEVSGGAQNEGEAPGEQKMVPLAALHSERSRRQSLQKEKDYLTKRLELLEGVFQSQLSVKPYHLDESNQGKDDGPLDHRQARKLFQDIYHLDVYPEVLALREEIARLKYPDYDEVVSGFTGQLRANPVLQQAVLNADDPAEMAYRMAKQGASLSGSDERQTPKKTIERIEKNLNSPRTPTAKGGEISPEGMTIEKLLEMPQDEFSRVWDSLTTAQRRKLCEK